MRLRFRSLPVVLAAVLLIIALGIWLISHQVNNRSTAVVSFTEGGREVRVYQIGDPQFPFGPTRGRLVLFQNGRQTAVEDFEVLDDGAVLQPQNFRAEWKSDRVEITVCGSEQDSETFTFPY